MNEQNICIFIPDGNENEKLHIINFVLETKQRKFNGLITPSVYQMYYARKGTGFLHTSKGKQSIAAGDIFFTFPSFPFAIESEDNFEYMYISYLGARANKIYESLGINRNNCVFRGYEDADNLWMSAINVTKEASALRAESVVLYTFSLIAEKTLCHINAKESDDAVLLIKKHIDDNLSNAKLSLAQISAELSYNQKYISSLFKKKMGIGISEYISTVRIQHACTLMEQGFTSIKDIASLCGFKDALYFSKVFKEKMGKPPKEHIAEIKAYNSNTKG